MGLRERKWKERGRELSSPYVLYSSGMILLIFSRHVMLKIEDTYKISLFLIRSAASSNADIGHRPVAIIETDSSHQFSIFKKTISHINN